MLKKKKIDIPNIIIGIILIAWGFAIFYPFYRSVLISFMKESEMFRSPFPFYVKEPIFDSYKTIFSDARIMSGFSTTLKMLLIGVPLTMFLCVTLGYTLSRKPFFLSRTVNNLVVLTMYFSGGTIPLYLTVKGLGLMDSFWSLILPSAVSTYNMVLVRSYFYTLPDALEESAKIEGANDITIFARIFLPLAKPILATVFLFICVAKWNEWYHPMLYLSSTEKWPLQLVLRDIISETSNNLKSDDIDLLDNTFTENVKMAAVVVTTLPIMVLYPFLQKYFIGGLVIGAVKG